MSGFILIIYLVYIYLSDFISRDKDNIKNKKQHF